MIKENLYALQEDLLRAYIVFNPKKLHVPDLKRVKISFITKEMIRSQGTRVNTTQFMFLWIFTSQTTGEFI